MKLTNSYQFQKGKDTLELFFIFYKSIINFIDK